jgi:peptide/nickel transport system permease protein
MLSYLARRLLLIPVTLLAILLINFTIINLAPGDPSTVSTSAMSGDGSRQAGQEAQTGQDEQYLLFREHYGLTLPILFNTWPGLSSSRIESDVRQLALERDEMKPKRYSALKIRVGDQAKYVLPTLLAIAQDSSEPEAVRREALRYFVRGATRMGVVGTGLSREQRVANRQIATDNHFLRQLRASEDLNGSVALAVGWLEKRADAFPLAPSFLARLKIFFSETRFTRYFTRVLTLDFGSLRNDANRTVLREVSSRIKYSLTLALFPMLLAFVLCQVVGFIMAVHQNRWPDFGLNCLMLVLYAIPIFVVAPFLIEKIALHSSFIPISGFHSAAATYSQLTSWQRLLDIALHLLLPLIAIMYGTLAAQSRLSRTAILEVLRQDYVRTARAKGVPPFTVLWKHVGRNAAITIVTSLAASLGVILGGSLIVETIFGIDGFGRFFYEAIVNRDYNVVMFSALAGAALALIGYLIADIAYTFLDPRVTLS